MWNHPACRNIDVKTESSQAFVGQFAASTACTGRPSGGTSDPASTRFSWWATS
jgi:hypothetical protein